jgi:hypothetical protein
MNTALETAEKIRTLLTELRQTDISDDARYALAKDTQYIEKCISILTSADNEAVEALWRDVQYLSRFFGGDYVSGDNQRRLTELSDQFQKSLLDVVVRTRSAENS